MNNKSELVSVIVPVYNVEKYLEKCVKSIIAQSYHTLEIILVDDGSTDSSGKLCDAVAVDDERIHVIHKKNGGLSDARNAGLNIANGSFYMFVDSDDYLTKDAVESMLVSAIENNCEIAVCNMVRFSEEGDSSMFYCPTQKETVYKGDDRFRTLNQPSVCNKLFRAELFKEIRFPKGKYYEDTFVYHELVYQAQKLVLTGKDSYWYLQRQGSILEHSQYTNRYFDFVEAVYIRAKFLIQHHIQPYGNEACLSLYAALSNAEKCIKKDAENKNKFKEAHRWYKYAYLELKKPGVNCSIKQKIRLFLLNYIPILHSHLY